MRRVNAARDLYSCCVESLVVLHACAAVFHGFGGRLAVHDVGPTMMNTIMHYCFKEIHLRRRDLNGKNQFGQFQHCVRHDASGVLVQCASDAGISRVAQCPSQYCCQR